MAKATHTGICQACGRRLNVTDGLISHHKPPREHVWTTNKCGGSGFAPLEVSCERTRFKVTHLKETVAWHNRRIQALLVEDPSTVLVWHAIRRGKFTYEEFREIPGKGLSDAEVADMLETVQSGNRSKGTKQMQPLEFEQECRTHNAQLSFTPRNVNRLQAIIHLTRMNDMIGSEITILEEKIESWEPGELQLIT